MDRKVIANVAVGAASTIALHRFAGRPGVAAIMAGGLAATAVFATVEPDIVILVALGSIALALTAS